MKDTKGYETYEERLNRIYESIIYYEIANEGEINLVICINGYNEETLNDIIYIRTGYRDLEQFLEEE